MSIFYGVVSLIASIIGAISGIGGGIIIKPILDSTGLFQVATISFLSGCTVLAMSATNLVVNIKNKVLYEKRMGLLLVVGSAVGGFLGSQLLSYMKENRLDNNQLGLIQTILLLVMNIGVAVFIIHKCHIQMKNVKQIGYILLIGTGLGLISAFLGIGGGPINLAILTYFFSFRQVEAARTSLLMIFFAQLVSLVTLRLSGHMPEVPFQYVWMMCLGGIVGGLVGTKLANQLGEVFRSRLFLWIIGLVMMINVYNLVRYAWIG